MGALGKHEVVYNDEYLSTEIGQIGTQFDGPGHIGALGSFADRHAQHGRRAFSAHRDFHVHPFGTGRHGVGHQSLGWSTRSISMTCWDICIDMTFSTPLEDHNLIDESLGRMIDMCDAATIVLLGHGTLTLMRVELVANPTIRLVRQCD